MEVDIKVVDQNTEELLIISGMSGSGKSTVIKALEDIGYFCVDNFPAAMINELLNHLTGDDRKYDKVALTIDTRSIQSVDEYANVIDELNERDIPFTTLFLDSEDDVLLRRYKETRRLHPFMDAGRIGLEEAIAKERDFLNSVKNGSDMILDTSHLSTAETKQKIIELFDYDLKGRLNVHFISFGFKYGILQDADIVFDVRCLK
ncbi:MAG: RNase adaptor protein RapZ, partial [Erysipelothrix sp.]|nr:RNase adaptor protein RapZ [Erysipelothrix sp.]